MMNYILYTNEYGDCIAEVFNYNESEMLDVQKQLVAKGYLILEIIGRFIKCHKTSAYGENNE